MARIGKTIRGIERFIMHHILHADDTPHRLALGIALGFFVAWTPTIGLQMVLVLVLATAFRANRAVGLPVVWISNPFTLVPIYYPNYVLGRYLLSIFSERPTMSVQQLVDKSDDIVHILTHIFDPKAWQNLGRLFFTFLDVSLDIWVGSFIIGSLLGVVSYFVSYKLIVWYRTHTPRGRLHVLRMLRRKERKHEREQQK